MLVYAVVSADTESAVELFLRREDAERMVDEALSDEPVWAGVLSVEPLELRTSPN